MSGLPKGWVEAELGDICTLLNGRAYKKPELLDSGKYPVLRVGNFFTSQKWYYSDLELDPNKYCDDGDLLYAWSASFGPRIWYGGKVIYHYHIWRVDIVDTVVAKGFLYNWFHWDKENIKAAHGTGSTMIHVTKRDMEKRSIDLPPLAEQKRIVAKLDALSARSARAREALSRIDTLVTRYKQAVLAKAFAGELTKDWRSSGDWPEAVRLDNVATSFSYGSSAKSSKSGAVPVLRMGNIQGGELDWSDLVYSDDEQEIEKYRLKSGDVLFNRTNSPALVGKTALYRGERDAIYAGYLIRIVSGPNLLPEYLNYALNSPEGRAFSWRVKSDGVSQSNISAAKLKGFEFSVPPLNEQKEIVRRIESAFQKIDRLAAEAKRALALTDKLDEAILAKAFRGELVPQDPTDEPASRLLERIKAERAATPKAKRVRMTTRPQRESLQMAKTVIETLKATDGWIEAPILFEACGVRDGSSTEEVEEIYKQLLLLERQEKIAIEPVYDTAGGAKVTDKIRLLE